ncbi:MAG: hypothetical protein LBR60_07925 [Fibrobacter sp.]|jgi:hypothetical protein|nr:hypothetical protein [Fibrobacter sp.]
MKSLTKAVLFSLAAVSFLFAETPVYDPWSSFGLGIGFMKPTSNSWEAESDMIFQAHFLANFQILSMTSVVADVGYAAPGNGFDAHVGFQQQIIPLSITPFIGGLAGINCVTEDNRDLSFGKRIGPSLEANGGVLFFRESFFQIRAKGGYEWIFNKHKDQGWKVEIGVLFANSRPGLKAIDVSR